MKTILALLMSFMLCSVAYSADKSASLPTTPDEVYKDVEKTLGFVPEFIKVYPKEGIVGAWTKMKQLEMGKTNIDNKHKELISLAVAATVPCQFCITFHTAAAKANGATDSEVAEAVGLAGGVREWSAVLNGLDVDKKQFDKDVTQIINNMKKAEKKMAE